MLPTQVIPYLFFGGRCDEAIEHYGQVLRAKVQTLMRHSDNPEASPENLQLGFENKVMHATLRVGGAVIMASDGSDDKSHFDGFRILLGLPNEADARRAFDGLANGGTIQLPIAQTFWSPCFGMVTDRFGVAWMITIADAGHSVLLH